MGNSSPAPAPPSCNFSVDDFLEKKARQYTIKGVKESSGSRNEYTRDLCASCNEPIGFHKHRPVNPPQAPPQQEQEGTS